MYDFWLVPHGNKCTQSELRKMDIKVAKPLACLIVKKVGFFIMKSFIMKLMFF